MSSARCAVVSAHCSRLAAGLLAAQAVPRSTLERGRVRRQATRLARQHDPLRPRDLDAVLPEGREEALAQLAGGGPLLRGANRAQDLEGDAVLAERGDAIDPRRLEDAALPGAVR